MPTPPTATLKGFPGFRAGKTTFTPLPLEFFTELLPLLDDLNELKAILYAFWRLHQGEGDVRYVRLADALHDARFLEGMGDAAGLRREQARQAFTRAVQRGVLIEVSVRDHAESDADLWYFLNSPKGREAAERLRAGDFDALPGLENEAIIDLSSERPNIYALYEQNIGVLTPMMADKLRQAERDYPESWLRDAFAMAVAQEKRNWNFVARTLQQWAKHGKDTLPHAERDPSPHALRNPYGDDSARG